VFLGHFALGFGAKRLTPAVSLGTLLLACQWADLLWPTLVLLGVEQVEIRPGDTAVTPLRLVFYPYSHSLVALIGWGALFAAVYRVARRSTVSAAVLVGLLVMSHWVLDFATHRPDLPLTIGGETKVGLGLWNSVPGTILVESVMFVAGIAAYLTVTEARDRIGSIAFWGLVLFMIVAYAASVLGPPPPGPAAVAWAAQGIWLIVAWGYWVDRHRRVRQVR
jgi:hypothetical protein